MQSCNFIGHVYYNMLYTGVHSVQVK